MFNRLIGILSILVALVWSYMFGEAVIVREVWLGWYGFDWFAGVSAALLGPFALVAGVALAMGKGV